MRKAYAPHIATASEASLKAIADSAVTLNQAVQQNEGAVACANFAVNGPAAFAGTESAAAYEDLFLAQVIYVLRAAREGMDTAVTREDATDADWQTLINYMSESGSSKDELAAIVNQDPTNPILCGSMNDMLNAMDSEPSGAGSRVRAQFFTALSAS